MRFNRELALALLGAIFSGTIEAVTRRGEATRSSRRAFCADLTDSVVERIENPRGQRAGQGSRKALTF